MGLRNYFYSWDYNPTCNWDSPCKPIVGGLEVGLEGQREVVHKSHWASKQGLELSRCLGFKV